MLLKACTMRLNYYVFPIGITIIFSENSTTWCLIWGTMCNAIYVGLYPKSIKRLKNYLFNDINIWRVRFKVKGIKNWEITDGNLRNNYGTIIPRGCIWKDCVHGTFPMSRFSIKPLLSSAIPNNIDNVHYCN